MCPWRYLIDVPVAVFDVPVAVFGREAEERRGCARGMLRARPYRLTRGRFFTLERGYERACSAWI